MVYIPWANFGVCKYWMLKRCYSGSNCHYRHPSPKERKWLWDEETRRQDEEAAHGIPRPRPPRRDEPERNYDQDRGVSALDAPPSPKPSPKPPAKKAKGVNSTQPGLGNANLQELGRPNRLFQGVDAEADSFKIKGRADTPQGMQNAPIFRGYNQSDGDHMLSDDIPSPFAVTTWRRPDMPGGAPDINQQNLPESVQSYLKGIAIQNGSDTKMKDGKSGSEGVATTEQSRPMVPRAAGLREPHASPAPAFSPLTIPSPGSMGATKRLSNGEPKHVGPHPSTIRVSAQYVSQNAVEKKLRPPTSQAQFDVQERSIAEAREDSMRLQGCTWIDNVRRALQLPIRTYTTACVYYHKFRLAHPGILNGMEYGNSWTDACAASLLTSCKTEDTLKKSRDILAAAYNLKANTPDQVGLDDPMFDTSSRAVIGLERLVLESGGFDFRSKYPHKLLMKIVKHMPEGEDDEREKVTHVAWSALTDLYRTFAPLKQTAATMALASLELAAHLVASSTTNNTSAIRDHLHQYDTSKFSTSRSEIMETLLDALDTYTQHTASTILGPKFSLDDFLRIRLAFNKECSEKNLPRHTISEPTNTTLQVANGHPTPVSPPTAETVAMQASGNQQSTDGSGTQRFVLNPQLAAEEKVEVQKFFVEEYEEYETEEEVGPDEGKDSNRSDKGTPRSRDGGDNARDRLSHREREIERDRARIRERQRDGPRDGPRERPRFGGRPPYEDRFDERERRFEDRRDRRFEDRRGGYEDDRRRRH